MQRVARSCESGELLAGSYFRREAVGNVEELTINLRILRII